MAEADSTTNDQFARLNVLNSEGSLSDVYRYTLRMSQVMQTELPEETKKKIADLRALLTTTVTKKNLIDGSETQVDEPSELSKAYFEKMAAYESAALEYNARRINALSASTPQDVHYWAMNADILRNQVKAAMMDWVANGYKNDYEEIAAFIDQVMQRDMSLLKQEYLDDLEKARVTGIASGSDFFYTSLIRATSPAPPAGLGSPSPAAISAARPRRASAPRSGTLRTARAGWASSAAAVPGAAAAARPSTRTRSTRTTSR